MPSVVSNTMISLEKGKSSDSHIPYGRRDGEVGLAEKKHDTWKIEKQPMGFRYTKELLADYQCHRRDTCLNHVKIRK